MSHCTCGCGHGKTLTLASSRITGETTVEEAKRRPGALEVLQQFGINHCCGAHLSLREAAAAAGASLEDVIDGLAATGDRA